MGDRKRPLEKRTGGDTTNKINAGSKSSKRGTATAVMRASGTTAVRRAPIAREEEEEEEEGSESDEEEEDDVSRALFFFADELIADCLTVKGKESELFKAKKALEKCKFLLLHANPPLQKMLDRAKARDMSDNKVPPGSASVQRTIADDRYLLCLASINCSKLEGISLLSYFSPILFLLYLLSPYQFLPHLLSHLNLRP